MFPLGNLRRLQGHVAGTDETGASYQDQWADCRPQQTEFSPKIPMLGLKLGRTLGALLADGGTISLAVCHTGPCLASWFHHRTRQAIYLAAREQWKGSTVVHAYDADCISYQGISLLPTAHKIVFDSPLSRLIPFVSFWSVVLSFVNSMFRQHFGMWRHILWLKFSSVLDEQIVSIFRVEQ